MPRYLLRPGSIPVLPFLGGLYIDPLTPAVDNKLIGKDKVSFPSRLAIYLRCFWFALGIVVSANLPVLAETGEFNVHLELAPAIPLTGWQADELGVGLFAAPRLEWAPKSWLGVQAAVSYLQFFKADPPAGYRQMDAAYGIAGSLGARLRLFNDETGYLWAWKKTEDHAGNLWGNLWIDLHGNYIFTGGHHRFGADLGLGAELSLINGVQVGPFARGFYIYQPDSQNERDSQDSWILLAGLSISLAIPPDGKTIPDGDKDGLLDNQDQCPDAAEDMDKFADEDGCPDPDNDDDGLADELDRCPNKKEDNDGFKDEDGCPDPDNDRDQISDTQDHCPDQAEDMDEYADEDGCPDPDNDQDGIPDKKDQCPDEAEIVNRIKDKDGCPEPDRDQDGFIDELDKCPDEPETVNGVKDHDGCPDEALVEVQANRILGGDKIFFDFESARIKTQSRAFLKQLVQLLENHPEYAKISIKGHTDRVGSADFNYKLSYKRAERVRNYLVKAGIDPSRLEVEAYGESTPLRTNRNIIDQGKNRRVEFTIQIIDETKAQTPVAPQTKAATRRSTDEESPPTEPGTEAQSTNPEEGPDGPSAKK